MTNATQTMGEMLIAMGGRMWERGEMRRIYLSIDVCSALVGLRVTRYGSGNISSATIGGDRISNGDAAKLVAAFDGAYYDVTADKFVSKGGVAPAARDRLATANAQ